MTRKSFASVMLAGSAGAEQEVLTPPEIIADVHTIFGGAEIALDPCSPVREPSFHAETRYTWPEQNGLTLPWRDRTYFNPPYADLEAWLAKASVEALSGARIAGLFPWRGHRPWFRRACAHAWLDHRTVAFVGHKTKFPMALVLAVWNASIPYVDRKDSLIHAPTR